MRVVLTMFVFSLCATLAAAQTPSPSAQGGQPTAQDVRPLTPGANSFAESQARAAIVARGYDDVSPLVNDSHGIWRGTARKGETKVEVSIDYKGQIDVK